MRNHPERALAACAPPHTRGPDTSRVAPLSLAWVRHFARGSDGMRVGSMVCAWATPTRISRGWRACHGVNAHCQRFASGTPGQAPLRPQRRPPCPRHPIVGVCYRGGLRLGRHTAPRRDLTDSKRGNCTIRGTTRRRHAEGRLLMLQNPPSSPGCGGVAEVNCVPESPASQNIWAITPMPAIVRRGGLHCGRHIPANRDLTTPNRGLTTTKRGELRYTGTPCVTCLPMTSPSNGGNCTIRGATRRRHAEGRLLMLQNPHHYPWRHAPARVERTRSGGILPMGRIPSEALRREHASTMTDDASARHRQPPSAARSRQRHRYLPRRC